jgi:hypothetical protein
MILLARTPDEEQEVVSCPHCQTETIVSCIAVIDTLPKLHSLLDGTLNSAPCEGCGQPVTPDVPLLVDMEGHGLEQLVYVPFNLFELACTDPEYFSDPGSANQTYYSRNELARQVQARIMIRALLRDA